MVCKNLKCSQLDGETYKPFFLFFIVNTFSFVATNINKNLLITQKFPYIIRLLNVFIYFLNIYVYSFMVYRKLSVRAAYNI